MGRFSATTLDLSRFAPPLAIRGLDYEQIIAARLSQLKGLFDAAGLQFNVSSLKTDPAVILQETDAYRELLAYSAVNDAVKAVMAAFAVGTDLDHLAAFYGVTRRIVGYADPDKTIPVYEGDEEFRRRVLLAPEAFATGGTPGGYAFHALSSDGRVLNADVWSPEPGVVTIAIQSREGDGTAPSDLIEAVRAHVSRDDIKPLTDIVIVRSVQNIGYVVSLDAYILPGPDPIAVRDAVTLSVQKMAAARRTPSRDMPRSAIIAAAQIGVVDRVSLVTPSTDIARGYGEVPVLTGLEVRVHTHDG